ncbi:MAG: hypothetical protein HZB13_15105 [Acidobacteria bacterium]|nr:hypothetical protein [Acidobacteriota bacterium]
MTPAPERVELIRELERASRALLNALTRRDPCFLEHLERREEALRRVSMMARLGEDGVYAEDLEQSRLLGASAVREARSMREETRHQLQVLTSQRRLAHSLGAAGAVQYTTLDLKA